MADSASSRWVLRPLGIAGMAPFIDVPPGGATLGRDPECTVHLPPDRFPQVSGQHARIEARGDVLEVTDLGSRNGTFVNGARTQTRQIGSGDVVQLGEQGPRFAIVHDAGLDDTLDVAPARPVRREQRGLSGMGESTITNLRAAIGAADHAEVRRSSRRTIGITVVLSLAVLAIAGTGLFIMNASGRKESDDLHAMNEKLQTEIESQRAELSSQRDQLVAQRDAVTAQRDTLAERIRKIEGSRHGVNDEFEARLASDLAELQTQLRDANSRLELFDPVNLERERLREVSGVHRAVVLIEATTRFRDSRTRRRLYVSRTDDGRELANLEFEGKLVEQESSGSGFCVSPEGYILTNAHVVLPVERKEQVEAPGGLVFDVETELEVVFTDTSERHPATLVRVTRAADEDLAVVKIEPFEGMPIIESFTIDTPPPQPGTEVFLFGFPLGKLVLQEGDRVVASTFKGILSREVGGYLQIDASVHPGNSGGPVTDAAGRVLGIVSRVQQTPQGQIANAIGYVIPIARAAAVWPIDGAAER